MKLNLQETRRLIAIALLAFLIAVTASLWLLDLVTQQRAFGFFLSSELLAFAILVYVYDRETPEDINWPQVMIGCSFIAMLIFFGILTP